jgi:endonuclease/exonuclease/phosphatase family metal-dependent hydrolase
MSLMRNIIAILFLACAAGLVVGHCREAAADEPSTVRVMTFNIRYDNPRDGLDIWANRKDKVASMVRLYQADIVGMQEAQRNQIDDLAERLPKYQWVGVGRNDGKDGGEFTPIFYRSDRLKLLEQKTFWLSPTPEQAGSRGWDAALPRIVTWAKFTAGSNGAAEGKDSANSAAGKDEAFFVFNTHFDHMGMVARLESAKLLRSKVAEIAGNSPAIVTGDFNCMAGSPPYLWMVGKAPPPPGGDVKNGATGEAALGKRDVPEAGSAGGQDALADAMLIGKRPHHGPTTTWNGFKALAPNRKIDHIFVHGPITVEQHAILADHWDGRFPSDHLPVMVEVTVGK